jgi:hypothetical protein
MESEGRKIDTEDMDRGTNSDTRHSVKLPCTGLYQSKQSFYVRDYKNVILQG